MNPYHQLSIQEMKQIRTHFKIHENPVCVLGGPSTIDVHFSVIESKTQENMYEMVVKSYDGRCNYKDTYKVLVEDGEANWELTGAIIEIDRAR